MSRVSTKPNFYNEVNTMEARIASLERAIAQLTALNTNPDWITPTLINSWASIGAGTTVAGYFKDPLGFVHLRGRIAGGANNTVAFVLPPGYRPGDAQDFYAAGGYTGAVSVAALAAVDTSGNVVVSFTSTANQVGLGGITFLAEN